MGRPAIIHKHPADLALPPNLANYAATCRAFYRDAARHEPAGRPGSGLNNQARYPQCVAGDGYYGRVSRRSDKIMRLGLPQGDTPTRKAGA